MLGPLEVAPEPFRVVSLVLSQNSPQAWAQRFGTAAPDILWLAVEGPRVARRLVGSLEKGEMALAVEPTGLDPYLRRLEKTANRIVLAMLMSALVIGGSFLVSVYHPQLPAGTVGPLLAGVVGAVATVGVVLAWKSRRKSMPNGPWSRR